MKKVLVIINAHFGYDGISSVAKAFYQYQNHDRIKMDFVVINPGDGSFENLVREKGDHFYYLTMRNSHPVKYMTDLIKLMRKAHYDIVHVHGNSATMAVELLAAYISGITCRIAHSHNTKCDHNRIHRLLFPLFRKLYTAGFACSKEAGDFLFPQHKYYVIHNGIDCEAYKFRMNIRNRIRQKYQLGDKFVIGNIGRLTFQKNQEFLIDLLERLDNSKYVLLLVGDGEDRDRLCAKARGMGIDRQVIFTGNIRHVNEIVQAMDIFVFPSRYEGLGIVVLEAQASGLGCLLSETVPGEVKIMDNTKFEDIQDIDKWVSLIKAYGQKNHIQERMDGAEIAVQKVAEAGYDIHISCRRLLQLYEELSS